MYRKIGLICLIVVMGAFMASEHANAYTGIFGIFPPVNNGPSSITIHEFNFDTTGGLPASITTNLFYLQSIIIETSPGMEGSFIVKEYPVGSSQRFDIIVTDEVQGALTNATLFVWANVEDDGDDEYDDAKTTVCHKGESKKVPQSALEAHLNHGDSLGTCSNDDDDHEHGDHHDDDEEDDDHHDDDHEHGDHHDGDGDDEDEDGDEEEDSIIVAHDHEGEPTIYESAYQVAPEIEGADGTSLWYFSVDQFSTFTIFDSLILHNNRWSTGNMMIFLVTLLMVSIIAPVALRQN